MFTIVHAHQVSSKVGAVKLRQLYNMLQPSASMTIILRVLTVCVRFERHINAYCCTSDQDTSEPLQTSANAALCAVLPRLQP